MQIFWDLNNFVVGLISCFAIEFLRIRNKNIKTYEGESKFVKIMLFLVYVLLGGFFVMLLNPNNVVSAIILGGAWDRFLISQIESIFGKNES